MLSTSQVILQNLLYDNEYLTKVLPYIKEDYFENSGERNLFRHISQYVTKYNNPPTTEAVFIAISNDTSISERASEEIDEVFSEIKGTYNKQSLDWLVPETQKFCEDQAMQNAVFKALEILQGEEKKLDRGSIPDLMKDALSISFDTSLGHDFMADAEDRFEYYHRVEEKVPFDIAYLNKITKGGFSKKTINVLLGTTHAGKSAVMVHLAASNLRSGKKVLYITLEMSEEEISKRIDANMMDLDIDDILNLPKSQYMDKIGRLKNKVSGQLKVKEYPMSSAHVGHFRKLLNDYKLKQGFIPDIIYVDYLNICASINKNVEKDYIKLKNISEELRALAQEYNLPIVTASQFNRGASGDSDPGMGGIAGSFDVLFGCDFVAALIATDDLKKKGILLFKQLKNRYDDMGKIPKFFMGFDRPRMKLYDLDDPEDGITSEETSDEEAVFDRTPSGSGDKKGKFGNFNF